MNIDDDYGQLLIYNHQLDDKWEAVREYICRRLLEGIVSCFFFYIVHILLVFNTWTRTRKRLQPIKDAMASPSVWMFDIHSTILSSLRLLLVCKSTNNREREIKKSIRENCWFINLLKWLGNQMRISLIW